MEQVFTTLGKQLVEIWKHFGINQKVSVIMALLVCVAAIAALLFWSTRADYRLLYSGLTLRDSASVREKIEDANIPLQVKDGGHAVYVPAGDVYRARLLLAAEGLPRETSSGFELFEQPRFGLTDFAQQINYQRALQGELEKTLTSMSNIEGARVTLVLPKERLFATAQEKSARASVMVTMAPGGVLSGPMVRSVTHLVASAVPGLDVSGITIVDQEGRLLSSASAPDEDQMINATDQLSVQRSLETQLTKNVQEMLDAFMGQNASVVQVNAAMDFSRIEQRRQNYDKDGRVVKVERILSESSSRPGSRAGGAAGTVVNVPVDSPEMASADQSTAKTKKENIQTEYAIPSGVEHILKTGARIRRLSVSVAVARRETPRTAEELESIRDLVRAAVGYTQDPVAGRLDSVEVKEMEFVAPVAPETTPWWLTMPVRFDSLARGLLMSVLLIVVFLAGRRILSVAGVQSADIGIPVRSAVGGGRGEDAISGGKEVDVDLFETMQAVKDDPKKAAAWIRRAVESGI